MSSSDAGASAWARLRQALRAGLAPWSVADGGVRELDDQVTMFTLDPEGDTVMCVRLNRVEPVTVLPTLRLVAAMLQYCLASELTPHALVIAEAPGGLDYADRADLMLIEDMFDDGVVAHGLWRDLPAVSRSLVCSSAHLASVLRLGGQLHLLSPPGCVDLYALPGLVALPDAAA